MASMMSNSKGTVMNANSIPGINDDGILNRNYRYQKSEESTN